MILVTIWLIDLKEIYCLTHWCLSISKERTVHNNNIKLKQLTCSSLFVRGINCIIFSFPHLRHTSGPPCDKWSLGHIQINYQLKLTKSDANHFVWLVIRWLIWLVGEEMKFVMEFCRDELSLELRLIQLLDTLTAHSQIFTPC